MKKTLKIIGIIILALIILCVAAFTFFKASTRRQDSANIFINRQTASVCSLGMTSKEMEAEHGAAINYYAALGAYCYNDGLYVFYDNDGVVSIVVGKEDLSKWSIGGRSYDRKTREDVVAALGEPNGSGDVDEFVYYLAPDGTADTDNASEILKIEFADTGMVGSVALTANDY